MTTDTKQDYTIDEVALWKADINPRTCHGSVRCAVDRQLPGYEKAASYLEQLEEQIAAGVLQPSCVEPPPEGGDCLIVVGSDVVYLSAEDARDWQPEKDNPLKSSRSGIGNINSDKPTARSTSLMLELLIRHGFGDDHRGRETLVMRAIQEQAERDGRSDKNLSETTIKRNLKNAQDTWKESK